MWLPGQDQGKELVSMVPEKGSGSFPNTRAASERQSPTRESPTCEETSNLRRLLVFLCVFNRSTSRKKGCACVFFPPLPVVGKQETRKVHQLLSSDWIQTAGQEK